MTLREIVFDALADDGESIIQIENYASYLELAHIRADIKEAIENSLDEEFIKIVCPDNKTINDFKIADDKEIEEFWFEMTEKGRLAWGKIEIEG